MVHLSIGSCGMAIYRTVMLKAEFTKVEEWLDKWILLGVIVIANFVIDGIVIFIQGRLILHTEQKKRARIGKARFDNETSDFFISGTKFDR